MSTTQNSDHDSKVQEELRKLPTDTTTGDYFTRAIELGGSPALLRGLAWNYVEWESDDRFKVLALPYIDVLLYHGRTLAQVREFVAHMCFTDGYNSEDSWHRQGFWNNDEALRLFETVEQFMSFMRQFAAKDPDLLLSTWMANKVKLGRYMEQLGCTVEQLLQLINELAETAVMQADYIHNLDQLELTIDIVGRKSAKVQIDVARRMHANGLNLVFLGYVLAKHGHHQDAHWLGYNITNWLERSPHTAPAVYRWLIEGFCRGDKFFAEDSTGPNFHDLGMSQKLRMIRSIFGHRGWHFLRTTRSPQGTLQVSLGKFGPHKIIQHTPEGEPLSEGEEVMVSLTLLKGLEAEKRPGTQIYRRALIPTRRPTPEMLGGRGYFYSGYQLDKYFTSM